MGFANAINNYSKLKKEIVDTKLKLKKLSHFNFILFPIVVLARFLIKLLRLGASTGHGIPKKFVNALLFNILKLEARVLKFVNVPFGVSILCLLRDDAKM